MYEFTPVASLIGGGLIGLAAALLMAVNGRVAGISGIFARMFSPGFGWCGWFVGGLILGGSGYVWLSPAVAVPTVATSPWLLAAGGVLVGLGTRLGSGCTSGHGVCGLARLSVRSLAATITFVAVAALTVFVVRHVVAGAPL